MRQNKDVVVKNGKFSSYCGSQFNNDEIRTLYLAQKTKTAARYIHKQETPYFNGAYYIGITKEE